MAGAGEDVGRAGYGNPPRRGDVSIEQRAARGAFAEVDAPPRAQRAAELLPSVTAPKGGGAIRGLGEKLSANPVTGSASISVPIPTSRGRSGFGPDLSLGYDSAAGNGPFGFGWSLGIPAVIRKTDKGLPRYLDGDESDTFVMSGAEDLVPILAADGQRVRAPRTVNAVAYDVFPYRPRVEGLFARIERWTRSDTGVSHWRTITRDNVSTLYGFDPQSRITDPADPRRVFSWLICRTFDDKGNVAVYDYVADDGRGVDLSAPHEGNRTTAERGTQRYIKAIRYGNDQPYRPDWSAGAATTPLPGEWRFQVVFDYGDHGTDAPLPAADREWPVRPDPFSTYRAGFEVRTYRRCERVLVFHHFPAEAGVGADCLVRATEFAYSDETAPNDPRNPIYTFLQSITLSGFRRRAAGYLRRAMPPMEFEYSQSRLQSDVLTLDEESAANLPEGLDGSRYLWADLDGEGLWGILCDIGGAWSYRRNLSPVNEAVLADGSRVVRARFGPVRTVDALPSRSELAGQRLLDLSGDGQLDVVALEGPAPGFFERTTDASFEPFRPFIALPELDWSDLNLRFVDLTGDGRADVLISEHAAFTIHPSLGEGGFGAAERVPLPWDEERGPAIVFADGTQSISLADMSGDGLGDIVRVRNGDVCYWPNLGYGRFGPRVVMEGAPRFASDDRFDARRVRLADIDGSGTTDIVYVGEHGVHVCFNRSGNAWAEPTTLAVFPGADDVSGVQVIDLLGTGTSCLVWSSPLPGESRAPLRYVDLMSGVKPHLMIRSRNNLGAETRLGYAPSTRFYLADEAAGRPWITRLPYPMHVVERVEVYDWIGRSRFVTRYAYHHGYFDGEEREFRGFGMVEQWDTEEHRTDLSFADLDPANWDAGVWSPPMHTRTWFHTGAFTESSDIARRYADEYWVEPALRGADRAADRAALLLPDTVVPPGLDADEIRQVHRALRGMALRTEVYADDETPAAEHPYSVTEQTFSVRVLQRRLTNRHAVVFAHPRESLTFQYERRADDPRVTHQITLAVDDFGNVERTVSIGYARRPGYPDPEPTLSLAVRQRLAYDQTRLHVVGTQNRFTGALVDPAVFPDAHRTPLPSETITAEVTGVSPAANEPGITNVFSFAEMDAIWQTVWDSAHDIPYEEIPSSDVDGSGMPAATPTRRVVEHTRTLYRRDDLTGLLPLDDLQPNALPGESYRLALTPSLVARVFAGLVADPTLVEGGYVQLAGHAGWWIPSGRTFYSAGAGDTFAEELAEARAHFYLPRRAVDAFGGATRIVYDDYDLIAVDTTDPVGNTTAAVNDYRVLQPRLVTDWNGNRTEVAFDALAMVAGTAVMGKTTESLGDSLAGFDPDPTDATMEAAFVDPLAAPGVLLAAASTRTLTDLWAYHRTRTAAAPDAPAVYTLSRETHVSDLAAGEATRYRHAFGYSDGFGREIQRKVQAERGPVDGVGTDVSPRWTGSDWIIHDNKGRPVRKYQPFFSATHRFEAGMTVGVSTVLFYDPPGRVVATLHPNDTWEKVRFDGWRQETWDPSDTCLIADPRADADVGAQFRALLGDADGAFTSWHARRIGGAFGATPAERAAEQSAAQSAAAHAATPTVTHFDARGRDCLRVALDGTGGRFATRTVLDVESKPLAADDALGRRAFEVCLREPRPGGGFRYITGYDLIGAVHYRAGMDTGWRRNLSNVAGKAMRAWDAAGRAFRMRYDLLQRPTHRFVRIGTGAELLVERSVYGEGAADRNLAGRVLRQYDGAGVVRNERYDFKGNLLRGARMFARDYRRAVDWSALAELTSEDDLDAGAAPLLNAADDFVSITFHDALNRPIQVVTPHAAGMRPNVIRSTYREAGLVDTVDVWVRAAPPTGLLDPATADTHAVTGTDYDARGKRVRLALGNGTVTTYDYDPRTLRLVGLTTTRPAFPANARVVQDLAYTYDPVGNVTRIRDTADVQNVVFFRNRRVEPSSDYTYDALYRLTRASGREHLGLAGAALAPPAQPTDDDGARTAIPHPGDGNGIGTYTETYAYDAVDNLLAVVHQVSSGSWTRRYGYDEPSRIDAAQTGNRVSATSLPGDPAGGPYSATYAYDVHGNMTRMPHLPRLGWDEADRLRSTTRQSAAAVTPETTFYVYDGAGERLRKVTDAAAPAGEDGRRRTERLYFGAFEIHRAFAADGTTVTLARESLHVRTGEQRVALLEARTTGTDPAPAELTRYQYANHLGSAALELDEDAEVISYEEYFPFGATAYQAVRSATETPKRYRYCGRERDEESALCHHGVRHYAPWLGRWTSPDPSGMADGPNLYAYSRNNPVRLVDHDGRQSHDPDTVSRLEPRFELTLPSRFDLRVRPGSVSVGFIGQARVLENTHYVITGPNAGRGDVFTSSAFLNEGRLSFSTRDYSLSLSARLQLQPNFSGIGSWPEDLSLQARITPRLSVSNGTLNLLDINASARATFLSADFTGRLRLNQPFQSPATYANVAGDLLRNIGSGSAFSGQLQHHFLRTFGGGMDFTANIRLLGLPITHLWGQIGQHTDVSAVGVVPVPAGTLFDVAAPLVGASTSRSGSTINWNLQAGVLPLISPTAISRGEAPSRMFPTYLYGKAELGAPNVHLGRLHLLDVHLGVEGSASISDLTSPQRPQPTFGDFIEQAQGRAAPERPAIGVNGYLRFQLPGF